MDDFGPPRSPDTNLTKNMHKLAAILGIVSLFWIALLSLLEAKPKIGPTPSWFHVYNTSSLVGWATWVVKFTMIDSNRENTPTRNKPHEAWNLLHIAPIALLNFTVYKSLSVKDKAQLWFFALMVFRYYRTVVTRFFYSGYRVAKPRSGGSKFEPKHCTVIVPTVGPGDKPKRFATMARAIILNKPARLIFSANNDKAKVDIGNVMRELQSDLAKEKIKISLPGDKDVPMDVDTRVEWTHVNHSNKRRQTCQAIGKVNQEGKNRVMTGVIAMVDDTAIWHEKLLEATLPAFDDPEVGLVGTHKSVTYDRPNYKPEKMSKLGYYKKWYWAGMWNTIGALYLMRHSYETEASNTADGGVFAVSGRTMLILAEIVQEETFKEEFENEYVGEIVFTWLTWLTSWHVPLVGYLLAGCKSIGLTKKGVGPLLADDDNFITRWVIKHGYSMKIQSSPEATMSTSLGNVKRSKFIDQCKRWSRTTFRQNPIALFIDRTIWWKWPISVWTVYFPWMYNGALFWDAAAVFTFWYSSLYLDSPSGNTRFCCLMLFMWFAKLNKTWPWFWEHPWDFVLYFIIPVYPLFTYFHTLLKFATAITCWNNEWSGRDLKKAEELAGSVTPGKAAEAAEAAKRRKKRLAKK
ncbi:hypothetical protein J4E86_009359 [Alternaria arbusti]|uniref:uncharacterized protein n=1 Tax=Alternaria arbusti TaxID=232088 RepID=UPI002221124C|nr:uncharacterized protein J4E86_009359 [Alternaria arbusti]KAI4945472.1 hypothetical protein J4E86_009359 [Alternaria arbusti]